MSASESNVPPHAAGEEDPPSPWELGIAQMPSPAASQAAEPDDLAPARSNEELLRAASQATPEMPDWMQQRIEHCRAAMLAGSQYPTEEMCAWLADRVAELKRDYEMAVHESRTRMETIRQLRWCFKHMVPGDVHTCSPQLKKSPEILISTDAIKESFTTDHSVDVNKKVRDHSPDAGKMVPVDYVKWLHDFAILRSTVDGGYPDTRMLQSLASQLTALRETVDGCGRKGEYMNGGLICGEDWQCAMCRETQIEILLALTYTDQGGETHGA